MVHLVVVEPDLYLYTLAALFWAYSSYRDNEQNMSCTDLRPWHGSDFCMNPFSRSRENDRDSEGDEKNDAD
jgi:hypothetical protein